ncbi:4-(cytidine 5'-diphospho)-2-C-methyl-D-erythritol kinase [Moritella viscosa]|uniref:4-diphosphocytidyl-2-C-methyl-D-erythritol kinase n=1 Tax=Moritella viscosa TaxID=80854 RepID=A0ABY1HFQ7_9GAMM|nr:4-(cytidine 5'-diphospho)-2-C-methyl-D-erythritol kinase [Moritella viscosa]SGY90750.1 4-diphosphocytidyl-2-C-methyl-D-erythritol kinase-4-(cytidine-5'-diphospho)-2-C-methyl-D-erythritol kinase [Moritella viscosa]SGZ00211.1 4-diphosphocytidyl-2-C-methyl-D-erythritol kinase-4-(cytidine-5'-diphospho)-2-C-methyl-D-erythritol kinase [Moritella viscosa]SHO26098.1 4-diphosphocytidyl-2-C-methyl-D-erythritol kinase-4-(cytidine-5'-diphospho)-2-C-methyl-D-erythritol kinase [Moritella viscosa]
MQQNTSHWSAPAKLNLFLYINGRRPDGYHELQTLFQFVDIGDELAITPNLSDTITITPEIPSIPVTDNIIYQAAIALKAHSALPLGADIQLTKNLPMGGGLGGGSSDAATTLVALNKLWQLHLDEDQLAAIGVKLGADVPVFVRGHAAFAEGIGEQLTSIEVDENYYLIVVPDTQVNTAKLFSDPELIRDTPKRPLNQLLQDEWLNDFEPTVKKRHPEVAKALEWLLKYAPSRLTGSGCCIFSEFKTKSGALTVLAKAPKGMQIYIAKGLNKSPLLRDLESVTIA